MTRLLPIALVFLALLPTAIADEEAAVEPGFTAAERDRAIQKAFAYLDEKLWRQTDRGSSGKQYAAAAAGWAYLIASERAGARLPRRTRELKRIRDYLEDYVQEVEQIYEGDPQEAAEAVPPNVVRPPGFEGMTFGTRQYCWGLGMTGLFFAESYERGKEKGRSKRVLKRLAAVLESAQQEGGGWGHDDARLPGFGIPEIPIPKPGGGTETLHYPQTLVAATNCAAAGLGAAYRVLRTKEPVPARKAIDYFRAAQNPNGSFPYDPSQKTPEQYGGMPTMALDTARTAGSVFALHCLGLEGDDEMLAKALDALDEMPEDVSEGHGSAAMALCFGALTARTRGEKTWAAFRDHFFPLILAKQDNEGALACVCRGTPGATCDSRELPGMARVPGGLRGTYGEAKRVYVTALHALILVLDRAPPKAVPPLRPAERVVTPGSD